MYAVFFDIDGTLIQTGGAGQVAFAETFRELFGVDEIPQDIAFAGRSDRGISADIMQRCGIEPSVENWNRFYDDYRQRLDQALTACQGRVLPGVPELLDMLEPKQHAAVGLLTGNTEYGANAKVSAYGLGGRFAFGGYGDLRTDRNHIAGDARVAAESYVQEASADDLLCGTMVIGDTPADVECGRAIDAFVVAVATGSSTMDELAACKPDLLLADLSNADALLAEVDAAEQRCTRLSA